MNWMMPTWNTFSSPDAVSAPEAFPAASGFPELSAAVSAAAPPAASVVPAPEDCEADEPPHAGSTAAKSAASFFSSLYPGAGFAAGSESDSPEQETPPHAGCAF